MLSTSSAHLNFHILIDGGKKMSKEKIVCSECGTPLCCYNKNKKNLCFNCQDGGEESVFFEPKSVYRRPRSGGKIIRMNISINGR